MRKSEKAATRGAADLQTQLADAWGQQLSHSGETYGRLFAAMREEFTGFVQKRLDANMATMRAWSECRSVNDALALQQSWVQCAVEHYVEQGNRIIETCRLAASDIAEAAQPAAEVKARGRAQTRRASAGGTGHQAGGLARSKSTSNDPPPPSWGRVGVGVVLSSDD